MREREALYFGGQILAAAICLFPLGASGNAALYAAAFLCFACALTAKLLVQRAGRPRSLDLLFLLLCAGGCLALGVEAMFPLLAALTAEVCGRLAGYRYGCWLTAAVMALFYLLYPCGGGLLIMTVVLLAGLFAAGFLVERLARCRRVLEREKEENDALRDQISDDRRLMKTLQYASRLEERNRLAARIHDKIGHGISGSIILLEGAMLGMERDPASAKATVETAVGNLRESVDDIRLSLRSERPPKMEAGLSRLEAALTRFSQAYSIRTAVHKEGRLEEIPQNVWECIQQNLTEALTNLLKHSDATSFQLKISVANRMVRVEFADNGRPARPFEKGMGLENMEERTVMQGGRCFFQSGTSGFTVRQLFPLKGRKEEWV